MKYIMNHLPDGTEKIVTEDTADVPDSEPFVMIEDDDGQVVLLDDEELMDTEGVLYMPILEPAEAVQRRPSAEEAEDADNKEIKETTEEISDPDLKALLDYVRANGSISSEGILEIEVNGKTYGVFMEFLKEPNDRVRIMEKPDEQGISIYHLNWHTDDFKGVLNFMVKGRENIAEHLYNLDKAVVASSEKYGKVIDVRKALTMVKYPDAAASFIEDKTGVADLSDLLKKKLTRSYILIDNKLNIKEIVNFAPEKPSSKDIVMTSSRIGKISLLKRQDFLLNSIVPTLREGVYSGYNMVNVPILKGLGYDVKRYVLAQLISVIAVLITGGTLIINQLFGFNMPESLSIGLKVIFISGSWNLYRHRIAMGNARQFVDRLNDVPMLMKTLHEYIQNELPISERDTLLDDELFAYYKNSLDHEAEKQGMLEDGDGKSIVRINWEHYTENMNKLAELRPDGKVYLNPWLVLDRKEVMRVLSQRYEYIRSDTSMRYSLDKIEEYREKAAPHILWNEVMRVRTHKRLRHIFGDNRITDFIDTLFLHINVMLSLSPQVRTFNRTGAAGLLSVLDSLIFPTSPDGEFKPNNSIIDDPISLRDMSMDISATEIIDIVDFSQKPARFDISVLKEGSRVKADWIVGMDEELGYIFQIDHEMQLMGEEDEKLEDKFRKEVLVKSGAYDEKNELNEGSY
ncbi:hypothetical protein ACFLTD_05705, partial [Elusimicrobiota bacterium]